MSFRSIAGYFEKREDQLEALRHRKATKPVAAQSS